MRPARNRSRQRMAILDCIRSTTCHPTADWVFKTLKPQMPELSLGTVYRNLNILRQDGEILSVGFAKGMEHFDGDTHPHAHFFCGGCGAVTDLMNVPLPSFPQDAPGAVGAVALTFHGTCQHCLTQETEI